MQRIKVKVDGIYDKRTIHCLKELGITEYGFDFRATSLNFLQQHIFLELLEEHIHPHDRYFLHYEHEQSFTIQKMIDDLHGQFGEFYRNNFILEFSDNLSVDFYEQFNTPYYVHFESTEILKRYLKGPNLRGVIFPYHVIEELQRKGQFISFVQAFINVCHMNGRMDLELGALLNSHHQVSNSAFDYLDLSFFAIKVDREVEVCYRNVDLKKVEGQINYFKNYASRLEK